MSKSQIETWVREYLAYDPETGDLTWLRSPAPNVQVGDVAGYVNSKGYRKIKVRGKSFAAHQLAWFLHTGEWTDQLDHENRIRDDNRISNLRPATNTQNQGNTSPRRDRRFKGVYPVSHMPGFWKAVIAGRYLGVFPTQEAAAETYDMAALQHFGEFAHLNFKKGGNYATS